MNEEMEPFEERVSQQALRRVPAEWREEILRAGNRAVERDAESTQQNWLAHLRQRFISLLWPSPKAWGALAAVWLVVLGINLSLREPARTVARAENAPSPEVIAELQQQRRLLAELIGGPPLEAELKFLPRPRSERRDEVVSV